MTNEDPGEKTGWEGLLPPCPKCGHSETFHSTPYLSAKGMVIGCGGYDCYCVRVVADLDTSMRIQNGEVEHDFDAEP